MFWVSPKYILFLKNVACRDQGQIDLYTVIYILIKFKNTYVFNNYANTDLTY